MNLFKNQKKRRGNLTTIELLKMYGNTVIRYSLYERYGEQKILSDLAELGLNCTLKVSTETHQPMSIRTTIVSSDGTPKKTIRPVMPAVIIKLIKA